MEKKTKTILSCFPLKHHLFVFQQRAEREMMPPQSLQPRPVMFLFLSQFLSKVLGPKKSNSIHALYSPLIPKSLS